MEHRAIDLHSKDSKIRSLTGDGSVVFGPLILTARINRGV
jgi:hypothetical protein